MKKNKTQNWKEKIEYVLQKTGYLGLGNKVSPTMQENEKILKEKML